MSTEMTERTALHWPEYCMEAAGLGAFMISACAFGVLLEHPTSPLRAAIASDDLRRVLMGTAMGLTAVGIVYSPWGRRSGAHVNPCLTLTFYRLGKIAPIDALFYVLAQFAGGAAGVWIASRMLGAAELYLYLFGEDGVLCAKLDHPHDRPCIFCAYRLRSILTTTRSKSWQATTTTT